MIFCMIQGANIFEVILPEKWHPAALYFQILCVYGLLYPLQAINVNILLAKGYSKRALYLEVSRKCLLLIFLFSAIPFGILGVIIGKVLYACVVLFINMHYCGKPINLNISSQLRQIAPIILLCIVSIVPISCFFSVMNISIILQIILSLAAAIVIYIIISYAIRYECLTEIVLILKRKK